MQYCPITYEPINADVKYSKRGLHLLSPRLTALSDLSLTAEEQRQEAVRRVDKMSVQGVQAKLSVTLNVKEQRFDIVDHGGRYILKPPSEIFSETPENEDLSMRLAALVGIEVPLHGLIHCVGGMMTYFIKRFDRYGKNKKIAVEDFAQLSGNDRNTKYSFSMERLIPIIEMYCTFPQIEKAKLLLRVLFNFLIGNEDMHLKNFSLITRDDKTELAPAYDFINSSIVLSGNAKEEIALPLNGKKHHLKQKDFVDYYAYERLGLNEGIVKQQIQNISQALPHWLQLIDQSFLSFEMKQRYSALLQARWCVLRGV